MDEMKNLSKSELPERAIRLMKDAIFKFDLNLQGLVILTEAASGNYIFTPLIAALAGANGVHAITRDSRYAPAKQVVRDTSLLAEYCGIADRIKVRTRLTPEIIGEADIVTNLAFVRPINREFVSHMKKTSVVPLMFETWEFREDDIDLEECWRKGICVLGTNEEDQRLQTFGYLGHLIVKKLLETGIEVFQSKIAVIGYGKFALNIKNTLNAMGAHVVNMFEGKAVSSREASLPNRRLKGYDAIIVTSHLSPELIIGEGGYISPGELKELCPDVLVIQLTGKIHRDELDRYKIRYLPHDETAEGHMSWPLSELGPRPVIELNTAGLKVGELMARARLRGLSRKKAEKEALQDTICQDFSEEKKGMPANN